MTPLGNTPDITLSEATEVRLLTRSGVKLRVRPVAGSDAATVNNFFDGLTPDDMMFRFLSGQTHLSSAQLTAMIGVDHRHREHLLAFDETGRLVASLLIAADEAFVSAEVAIAVAPAYKTRGVGWTLLNHAVDLTRSRGLKTLRSIESRANRGAMEVERTLGFKASDYDGDPTLALLELDLTRPV
jgi:GNAT superfamily N-acetyltransferase